MLSKIFVILFIATSCLSAQTYQSTLKIPPAKIYQTLLEYAKEKDYEKIKESLKFIDPIFTTLQKKFGKNIKIEIEEAVNKEDIQIIQNSLFRLIFYSMKDTLSSIKNKDSKDIDVLKAWLNMAYLDYSFISQRITDKNADTMIKTSFKKIYTSLAKKSPYIDITALDWRTINMETEKIEEYCTTLFPYFSN